MISVRINGENSPINTSALGRFTELVELIKSHIDPEHMITDIRINGRSPSDVEWMGALNQLGTAIIEIDSGTPAQYVAHQMAGASEIVNSIYLQFRQTRKMFQSGDSFKGNENLGDAVRTAKAFFDWYATMLQLVPETEKPRYDIAPQVEQIVETCKKICQQQLYQSWWALSETLEKELEPRLDSLETHCRKFTTEARAA